MARITVGYQDGCLAPLWVSKLGISVHRWLGAEALWVPDHFMGFCPKWIWKPDILPAAKVVHSMDALFDPVPLLTMAAIKHKKIWLGTSVTEPIRRHPMSLAQTFVTLDHISRGRAILGIGNGLRENTEPYGLPCDKRVARLEEAVKIIRTLWESGGEPVTFKGRFWQLRDAVFDLPLYQGKAPRLFMGAHFPRMLRMCGRYADGWLPGQKISGEEYAGRLAIIGKAAAEAGRSMDDFVAGQTLLLAFGRDRQAVLDKALGNPYVAYMACGLPPAAWSAAGLEHPMGPDFEGFLDIVPSRVSREQIDTALSRMTAELLDSLFFMGSVDDIAEQAEPLARAGCRHFIVANMGGAFSGEGAKDFLHTARLFRVLKRL